MPDIYRAPEIVLGMGWGAKVDIWAVGFMVGATRTVEEVVAKHPTKIGPGLELVFKS